MKREASPMQKIRAGIEATYAANIAKAKEQYWAEIRKMHEEFLTKKNAPNDPGERCTTDDYKRAGQIGFFN